MMMIMMMSSDLLMHSPILCQNGILTLCMLGNFACFFVVCGFFFFFLNYFFFKKKKKKKNFQEYHHSVKQFESRSDILASLIWIQTVCKGYQQTTKVATSGERVNLVWY